MSFLSKKGEVKLEDFCLDFYEKNIISLIINGVDAGEVYIETIKKSLIEVDQSFINVDSQKLAKEILPLRFELFALAWFHKFGDKLAVAQSIFTKHYLFEKKKGDIWNNCEPYGQAIARSSTAGEKPENAFDRAFLGSRDLKLVNLFEEYNKQGFDPECVVRGLNRLFTDEAWKKNITANFLVFTLCDRLGFKSDEPNKEAQFRLVAIIRGLYDGALQSLDKIKIKS